jgi:DHA2 family multidrug resistance protein
VGGIVLDVLNSGALSRPIDVLTFAGFFQTVRLFGGEAGAAFLQRFLSKREQFHSNILGQGVSLGDPATAQRLHGLTAAVSGRSTDITQAVGRAGDLLGLQVRQQAFTLAITDSFTLVAFAVVCCLVVVACMAPVQTEYRQVVKAGAGPA